MLFAIPASSADCERSFSSAGFTLDSRRNRMDVEVFRQEHRLRRFLVSGTDLHTQVGRQTRLDRMNLLINRYNQAIIARARARAAQPEVGAENEDQ